MRKTPTLLTSAAVALLILTGCGGSSDGDSGAEDSATGGSTTGGGEAVLSTTTSDFGDIVVDSTGRTVYVFDRDMPGSGKSACTGQCLENWPPVTSESDTPTVDGVSGDVGTIEWDDGTLQVTLDGWPLYTFADDAKAGDTAGQGVQGVWWIVDPSGVKVTDTGGASGAPGY
jgi:predicted lipoprotein with Yx(FWY)xxD motif